jgi:hypothetical protein
MNLTVKKKVSKHVVKQNRNLDSGRPWKNTSD